MTCRSALESQVVEFSGTSSSVPSSASASTVTMGGKVKNNFSIDHLLAKSDKDQSVTRENASFSARFPIETSNCGGFTTPDSSCGTYTEDYLDNASEDPSEDSFDNG